MNDQPDYEATGLKLLTLIARRLDRLDAQMQNLRSAVLSLEDYAELYAAATTDEAKTVTCAHGLTGPKQLLLVALRDYLSLPVYMSEEEERQFMEVRDRILAARAYPSGNS